MMLFFTIRTLVPLTQVKILWATSGCFHIKCNSDDSIARYKSRLVPKVFIQRPGVEFHDTFNPVINLVIVRLVLSLAVNQKSGVFDSLMLIIYFLMVVTEEFIWPNLWVCVVLNFRIMFIT